jgi:CheY-like chemotaxis protein/HPt (histidine-containing phosphotransfer) domain-containing protein
MTTLRGVRALIVESNVLSRGILHEQVGSWGMATRVAESPEHALELLKQAATRGVPMDMAIIDLGFAGGDPLALAQAIRSDPATAKSRLVMLAPVGNHAAIQEALGAGIDTCLVKPVRQSALYDALVNVMSGESGRTDARSGPAAEASSDLENRGSVLLVEDNLVNQAVALGMLSKLLGPNKVTVANNGREAIEALGKSHFDLILMDCHMPEVDGFQATREIRKREAPTGKRLPIIALTANAMAQDREECLSAGMDDHLGKPFSRKQIQEALERWLPKAGQGTAAQTATAPSKAPGEAGSGVLDWRVLGQLRGHDGHDDSSLLQRVIGIYIQDSPNEIARLAKAVADGDSAQIAMSAHSLKSSSANIGATMLSQQCGELEAAGRNGKLETSHALYTRIAAEHGQVQKALNSELAELVK